LYSAAKFVRRHRALVAGAGAVFLALSAAVVSVSLALVRVEQQHRRTAEVNAFMRGLLASADPFTVPSGPRIVGPRDARGIRALDMLSAAGAGGHPIEDPLVGGHQAVAGAELFGPGAARRGGGAGAGAGGRKAPGASSVGSGVTSDLATAATRTDAAGAGGRDAHEAIAGLSRAAGRGSACSAGGSSW
jgi:hypothetical protein